MKLDKIFNEIENEEKRIILKNNTFRNYFTKKIKTLSYFFQKVNK